LGVLLGVFRPNRGRKTLFYRSIGEAKRSLLRYQQNNHLAAR
jgi:hypothetical protein